MITKKYELNWIFQAPEAILACKILKCRKKSYLVFGGHDKNLYIMNSELAIIDSVEFDGWVRCIYTRDIDGDGCDEVITGTGDGNFLVLKFDEDKNQFKAIKHYITDGKVLCCYAEDLTRNGRLELILGGDNKKLIIFENLQSEQPKFIQYYDSWITACCCGILKLPKMNKPIMGLVIGTKHGKLQLIQLTDDGLNILWERFLDSKINDIKIADVKNNGKNEIIVCSDDYHIKILDSEGKRLRYLKIPKGRPLTSLIEDIDGDRSKEIIIGGADGTLWIYQNNELNSTSFSLKWSTKIKTSIKDMCSIAKDKDSLRQIIFGGYDRAIRNIADFEWGKKPILEIPKSISLPKVDINNKEELKSLPTNIEGFIEEHLTTNTYENLDLLVQHLTKLGYTHDIVKDKIKKLKEDNQLIKKSATLDIWTYIPEEEQELISSRDKKIKDSKEKDLKSTEIIKEEIDDGKSEIKSEIKEKVEKEKDENKGEERIEKIFQTADDKRAVISSPKEPESKNLKDIIIQILTEEEYVYSKSDLINLVVQKGFNEEEINSKINQLNDDDIITYSRSKPRGWTLVS